MKRNGKTKTKAKSKKPDSRKGKHSLFKFRRYKKAEGGKGKKAKHPKLIVDEKQNEFGFMGLTEEPRSGHHSNIPLDVNPKSGDKRKAYIRKELRYDNKIKFGEILEDYNLSAKDMAEVIAYIEKLNKKKK